KPLTLTLGRQRINLDDQRWVGASGWRQNEQTFDAVRGQVALGPVSFDGSFAESQRSIYGTDGGPRVAYDGRFAFLNAGIGNQIATLKGFAYLLDYNNSAFQNLKATRGQLDSSQTYGLRTTAKLPIEKGVSLALAGSYARQYSYAANPRHYAADYYAVEGNLAACGFTLTGGYEMMGADAHAVGGPWSVQTPMATLHAFDGWADVFLTTPARGLGDTYAGLAYAFPKAVPVPGLNAKVIYHQFDSDIGNVNYGHEWDAAIGFKTGFLNWLVKYADYRAVGASALGAGTTTRKFWLQSEFAF
ncbi:MAG TPA: alginate export family protein, partial [Novosphingobium sp.]|nr:alginate export family protein [Novosphingobium sp.]